MAKFGKRFALAADKRVTAIFPAAHRREAKARWNIGRNVFDAVNRKINLLFQQGFLELLDEHALTAYLRKRRLLHAVAGGLDDYDFGFDAGDLEDALADILGLPFRQQAAARADADVFHGCSRPGRKRSRMASTF